ncbi:heparinase II/III domain-containing protein [Paenibacillus chungangensis]|uniref:Heparinase II/III family protein n=1 Tax=Paenibacillus chungangensis TaxID=696535 RepID=A0ABW3HQP9_9BACL
MKGKRWIAICVSAFMLLALWPVYGGIGRVAAVGSGGTSSANIPVAGDYRAVVPIAAAAPIVDGSLVDSAWLIATELSPLRTFFDQVQDQRVNVKLTHDGDTLYAAIEAYDPDSALALVDVVIAGEDSGGSYYHVPIAVGATGDSSYVTNWGSHRYGEDGMVPSAYEVVHVRDGGYVRAEVAIPASSLGMQGIAAGDSWRFNIVAIKKLGEEAFSSWVPVRESYFVQDSSNEIVFKAYMLPEGRMGSVSFGGMGTLPGYAKAAQAWEPVGASLQYDSFQQKTVAFQEPFAGSYESDYNFWWVSPDGRMEVIDSPSMQVAGGEVQATFQHPEPRQDGMYRLAIHADGANEAALYTGELAFDRYAMIKAGEGPPAPLPPDGATIVAAEPASAAVQKVLSIIPEKTGIYFTGIPHLPDLRPESLYNWSPDQPNVISTKADGTVYPSAEYPETGVMRVTNRLGQEVEYPYYEDASGRKYFLSAHVWFMQHAYAVRQTEIISRTDPLGAARLLARFAELYPAYVSTQDYPHQSYPLNADAGAPYAFYGGTWHRWYVMDFYYLKHLVSAYENIKKTNAFQVLGDELNRNIEEEVVGGLFRASVEQLEAYPFTAHNLEFHNWQAVAQLAEALEDPRYIHAVTEKLSRFTEEMYLHDGFFKEVTFSYHRQSTNGVVASIKRLNGWSDPTGYVSARTGLRYDNLQILDQFPVLGNAMELNRSIVYPNGRYVPLQDTWANELVANPDVQSGSRLIPAGGIARMVNDGAQVHMTFPPKYGHEQKDPLNMTLFAKGQELLPDIGYTHTNYRQWTRSTLGHNTVVVDGADMNVTSGLGELAAANHGGNIEVFGAAGDLLQVTRASQQAAYPQTEDYARELWLIDFPEETSADSYVVDLFRVKGGERHEYTLQGDANRDAWFTPSVTMSVYGDYLLPPGTVVTPPQDELDQGDAGGHYYGYAYVKDVQDASLADGRYELALTTHDGEGAAAGLHIHGLAGDDGAQLFLGRSPSLRATRTEPGGSRYLDNNVQAALYDMPKMVVRREGTGLASQFVHVMEPLAPGQAARVSGVERLTPSSGEEGDVAVKIAYGNTTDYILSSRNGETPLVVQDMRLQGKLGFIRVENGVVTRMVVIGGDLLQKGTKKVYGPKRIEGVIASVKRLADGDSADGILTAASVPKAAVGQYAIVTHPDGKKSGFRIKDVKKAGEMTLVESDGLDPGFTVYADGSSRMRYFPFTAWEGEHRFHIDLITERLGDSPRFHDGSGNPLTELPLAGPALASNDLRNLGNSGKTAELIMVWKDEEGVVREVASTGTNLKSGAEESLSASIEGNWSEGGTLEAFLWDSLDTMRPLTAPSATASSASSGGSSSAEGGGFGGTGNVKQGSGAVSEKRGSGGTGSLKQGSGELSSGKDTKVTVALMTKNDARSLEVTPPPVSNLLEVAVNTGNKEVVFSGRTPFGAYRPVTALLLDAGGGVQYIGQTESDGGSFFSFRMSYDVLLSGNYTLRLGSADYDRVLTYTFPLPLTGTANVGSAGQKGEAVQ